MINSYCVPGNYPDIQGFQEIVKIQSDPVQDARGSVHSSLCLPPFHLRQPLSGNVLWSSSLCLDPYQVLLNTIINYIFSALVFYVSLFWRSLSRPGYIHTHNIS